MVACNQKRFQGSEGLGVAEISLAGEILTAATCSDWGSGIDAWFARRMRQDRPVVWEACVAFWHHSTESQKGELGQALGWLEPGKQKVYVPEALIADFEDLTERAQYLFRDVTERRMGLAD